jgi:hypothetical protein
MMTKFDRTIVSDDPFGSDPQVQYLRRVFASMEKKQGELLKQAGIGPLDVRLQRLRRITLHLFEKVWAGAARKGIVGNDEETGLLYLYCLARALVTEGIKVPVDTLPRNKAMEAHVEEVLK